MLKPSLLLHACCAPCSGYLVSQLSEKFDVSIYYDNSNIFPKEEFFKRSNEAKNYFERLGIEFIQADYNHEEWLGFVKGLEGEPERGKRCNICFLFRLRNTAKYAKEKGFDLFTSTLSISPHKDAEAINNIGNALSKELDVKFLEGDFKKNDGFKNSMEFSKENNFYQQNYCGCEFSMRS